MRARKLVYRFLGAPQNLALDIFMGGGGHSLKPSQAANIVKFADFVLFGRSLPDDVKRQLNTDPYLDAGTYDKYYGRPEDDDALGSALSVTGSPVTKRWRAAAGGSQCSPVAARKTICCAVIFIRTPESLR